MRKGRDRILVKGIHCGHKFTVSKFMFNNSTLQGCPKCKCVTKVMLTIERETNEQAQRKEVKGEVAAAPAGARPNRRDPQRRKEEAWV